MSISLLSPQQMQNLKQETKGQLVDPRSRLHCEARHFLWLQLQLDNGTKSLNERDKTLHNEASLIAQFRTIYLKGHTIQENSAKICGSLLLITQLLSSEDFQQTEKVTKAANTVLGFYKTRLSEGLPELECCNEKFVSFKESFRALFTDAKAYQDFLEANTDKDKLEREFEQDPDFKNAMNLELPKDKAHLMEIPRQVREACKILIEADPSLDPKMTQAESKDDLPS